MHAFIERLVKNPKTTLGGTVVGAIMVTVVESILSQAGCNFSNVQLGTVLAVAFGGPQLMGAAATDNGKGVQGKPKENP